MVSDRSNGGHWRYGIAAVGWLAVTGASNGAQGERSKQHQETAGAQRAPPRPSAVPAQANPAQPKDAAKQCVGYDNKQTDCVSAVENATIEQARDADWQANASLVGTLIGFLTLLAAGAAAWYAKIAAHETRRSANAAEAEQRAWLSLACELRLKFQLTDTASGRVFRAVLVSKVENHGPSVATDAFVHAELICNVKDIPTTREQFRAAYKAMIEKNEHSGQTIFPTGKPKIRKAVEMTLAEIAANKTEHGYVFPWAIVCLSYRTPHIKELRYTALAYQVVTQSDVITHPSQVKDRLKSHSRARNRNFRVQGCENGRVVPFMYQFCGGGE